MDTDELRGLVADLRTHAFDDSGERDLPTHVANQAADALDAAAARIAELEGAAREVADGCDRLVHSLHDRDPSETEQAIAAALAAMRNRLECARATLKGADHAG